MQRLGASGVIQYLPIDIMIYVLENTITWNDLHNTLTLISNCDKIKYPLAHRPGKRIAGKGQKRTITVTSDSKTCITVLSCINTAGYAIPRLVIHAYASLTKQFYQGEIPGILRALSPGSG